MSPPTSSSLSCSPAAWPSERRPSMDDTHGGIIVRSAAQQELRDLVAISTLPALWAGAQPLRIAESLAAALFTTVNPRFMHVCLDNGEGACVAVAQTGRYRTDHDLAERLRDRLLEWGRTRDPDELLILTDPALGSASMHVTVRGIGHHAELGVISAGYLANAEEPTSYQNLLINVAATQAATAAQNQRLLRSLEREAQERARTARLAEERARVLGTLNRTGTAMAAELDHAKLIQQVTDAATELSGAQFGAFFYNVTNAQGEAYMLYTLSGAPREAFARFGHPRNTAVFAPTFAGQGVVRSADIMQDARYGKNPPHKGMPTGHLPVRSYLAVPVTSRSGQVLGGLFFGHPEPGVFTEESERVVVGIASQAAIALDNAQLYEELRRSEARFRSIVEQSVAGIAETDPAGRYRSVNDRYCAIVGYTREQLLGMRMQDVTHPEDLPRNAELFARVIESGAPFQIATRYRRPDGSVVWVHNSVSAVRDSDGKVRQAAAVCIDISDRKRIEEELESHRVQLEELVERRTAQLQDSSKRLRDTERLASLGTLAAGLGHDLHNTLLPLRIHIQELGGAARRDPAIAENVNAVEAMIGYLASLSKGMQMLARDPEQGGRGGSADLHEWCLAAQRVLASAAGRAISFTCEVDEGTPAVAMAEHQVMQAVFNLVQNARDATTLRFGEARGGEVHVWARRASETMVEVCVRDNGPGMDESVRRRCLEPFFTTKARGVLRGEGGTGMGLALVNGLVTAAGGRIEIESEVGNGALFRLLIPVDAGASLDRPEGSAKVAVVCMPNPRLAAALGAMIRAGGWLVVDPHGASTAGAHLWISDMASPAIEAARAFLQHDPRRRAVLAGNGERPAGLTEQACCCDPAQGFATLREVVQRTMDEVSGMVDPAASD